MAGDVSLSADIHFPNPGGNAHRKAALIIRQGLDADSLYADAALHGSGLTALQFRSAAGAATDDTELNFSTIADAPARLRLEKRGDLITMYMSMKRASPCILLALPCATPLGRHLLRRPMTASVYARSQCRLKRLSSPTHSELQPLVEGAVAAKTSLYSTLETINIDPEGRRATVIYSKQGHFEAPNWTRDGASLLFDENGQIMTVAADGKLPSAVHAVDIGLATKMQRCSHGLSPDGRLMAISCSMPDAPGSTCLHSACEWRRAACCHGQSVIVLP